LFNADIKNWLFAKVVKVPAEEVKALVTAATTIESTRLKLPAVKTGAIVTAALTITLAAALLTVIKFGLPPNIATKLPPVIFIVPMSQKRISV
jgi:hypothetical protein